MRHKQVFQKAAGIVSVCIVWQFVSTIKSSPIIPNIVDVMVCIFRLIFIENTNDFLVHISSSLKIILLGLSVAFATGFLSGVFIFIFPIFKNALMPVFESMRGIAALSLFPLLIVILGIGDISRVFVIFWTAWPPVLICTIQSLDIDNDIVGAAEIDGADKYRLLINIRLPLALDGIFNGIRIGIGSGWISLIAAEMLGANKGVGYFLLWSSQSFHFTEIYASIIVIAALGGTMNILCALLQTKINLFLEE